MALLWGLIEMEVVYGATILEIIKFSGWGPIGNQNYWWIKPILGIF